MSERSVALTLRPRRLAPTLSARVTNPGVIVTGAADSDLILQGFEFVDPFDNIPFILYGLQGPATSTGATYGPTLRRRKRLLEVV